MPEAAAQPDIELTAHIVSAYVSNNPLPATELPSLIASVSAALQTITMGAETGELKEQQKPAVPIRKSVTPDYIISLEDGQKFRSLKRPLMSRYGMTPDEYRSKWGLPRDYPMVAPNYAAARSELARRMGLGRNTGDKAAPATRRGRNKAA